VVNLRRARRAGNFARIENRKFQLENGKGRDILEAYDEREANVKIDLK
jgi:hypothetical protein